MDCLVLYICVCVRTRACMCMCICVYMHIEWLNEYLILFTKINSVRSLHHDPPVLGCITGMADELWTEVCDIAQDRDQDNSHGK